MSIPNPPTFYNNKANDKNSINSYISQYNRILVSGANGSLTIPEMVQLTELEKIINQYNYEHKFDPELNTEYMTFPSQCNFNSGMENFSMTNCQVIPPYGDPTPMHPARFPNPNQFYPHIQQLPEELTGTTNIARCDLIEES